MTAAQMAMNAADDIATALLGHDLATRRRFRDMTAEQRRYVSAQWQRHVRACRAAEIDTEPRFLPELIEDVMHGFITVVSGQWSVDSGKR